MFFCNKNFKYLNNKSYFKNLGLVFLILFFYDFNLVSFYFFRFRHHKKYLKLSLLKILLFYKIYKNFIIKIKKFFITHLFNNFWKQLNLILYSKHFITENRSKNQDFYFPWFFNKKYFCIKFFFSHILLSLDFLKEFYFNVTLNFNSIFLVFVKLFIKTEKNLLFFQNLLYLTNLYLNVFENFISRLKNSIFLKNFSYWKIIKKQKFNSYLYYLYRNTKYILYYIRCSNIVSLYLCCKIKYLLQIYKKVVIIFRYVLKLKFKYSYFNLTFRNKKVFKNFSFINNSYYDFNFSKLKLRLYFLFNLDNKLLLNKNYKKNKVYKIKEKKLIVLITRNLLEYLYISNSKKLSSYKINFLITNYLCKIIKQDVA